VGKSFPSSFKKMIATKGKKITGITLKYIPKATHKKLVKYLLSKSKNNEAKEKATGIESNIPQTELIKIVKGHKKKSKENFSPTSLLP
jgi:hypothetical protein